ncbi:hypothetical protein BDZ91DRAFT_763291 [Kalaharituber pfeilii]|nr:hypothetical protein BDZ91DRAFT_763291 [Kalaharituber pfeilii]
MLVTNQGTSFPNIYLAVLFASTLRTGKIPAYGSVMHLNSLCRWGSPHELTDRDAKFEILKQGEEMFVNSPMSTFYIPSSRILKELGIPIVTVSASDFLNYDRIKLQLQQGFPVWNVTTLHTKCLYSKDTFFGNSSTEEMDKTAYCITAFPCTANNSIQEKDEERKRIIDHLKNHDFWKEGEDDEDEDY